MVIAMSRVILHADLNNFYASVECLYNPELRDRPVAVCGSQSTRHGIVLAKNIAAKRMGVKTGEAIWQARDKCPRLIIVRPNYSLYLRFSMLARQIYEEYTTLVESFGIDENWLDVTESTRLFGCGEDIAEEIRRRVAGELGITVSVGVSYNKIFAKLASDMKKPDIVTVLNEGDISKEIWPLPVEELLYVGRSTSRKLRGFGICTIGDLANTPLKFLKDRLGKWGETLWLFANGYDSMPVAPTDFEEVVKGVGNSLTTPRDLENEDDIKILTYVLAESVGERLRRYGLKGRTVQIYIRDRKLNCIERQGKLPRYTNANSEIAEKALDIFARSWRWDSTIRSYGVRVTDLVASGDYIQPSLFNDERHIRLELLDRSIDDIRRRFGHYSVQRSLLLKDKALNANPVEENIIHPISYFR